MGQKINPYGLRLGIVTDWKSRWYSEKDYASQVNEDNKIRTYLRGQLKRGAVSRIDIERIGEKKVQVDVHTARPGVVIGRGGSEAERLRRGLENLSGRLVKFNVIEVQSPDLDATLLARSVADQLEGRVSFRRAMKRAVSTALKAGAEGVRVQAQGRLGGADMGRREWYLEGRVPLHTLRADIDYGEETARTTVGAIGVKVWVYKGDVLRAGGPSREKIAAEARLATGGPAQRRRSARSRAEAAAGGKEKRLIEAGGGKRLVEAGGGKRKEGGKRLIEAGGGRKPSPSDAVQEFQEAREEADETLSGAAAAAAEAKVAEAVAEEAVVEAVVAEAVAEEAVVEAVVAEAVAEEAVVEAVVADEVADVATAIADVADAEAAEAVDGASEAEARAESSGSPDAIVDALTAEDTAAEAVAEAVEAEVVAAEASVVAEIADEAAAEAVIAADDAIESAVDAVEDAALAEAAAEVVEAPVAEADADPEAGEDV
jgi:small subunit ribosomal protein S3